MAVCRDVTLAGCPSVRPFGNRKTRRAAISGFGPASTLIPNWFSRIALGSAPDQLALISFKTCAIASKGQSKSQLTIFCNTLGISGSAFGYEGYSYGTETKVFGEPELLDGTLARLGKNEGVRKMKTAQREAVIGSPDLGSLTTSHIERVFLSVRQELKRFQRKGLGYSKDLETHKAAVALHFGIYNFVRVHKTLGTTPAVAAGIELERWGLEDVVEMTAEYFRRKEDSQFENGFRGSRTLTDDAVHLVIAYAMHCRLSLWVVEAWNAVLGPV